MCFFTSIERRLKMSSSPNLKIDSFIPNKRFCRKTEVSEIHVDETRYRSIEGQARRRWNTAIWQGSEGWKCEIRLTTSRRSAVSNSFRFAPASFLRAPVHKIFNKKVDISYGAFCRLFVPPLFRRKRKGNGRENPSPFHVVVQRIARFWFDSPSSTEDPPSSNPRASSSYKQHFPPVVLSIPFSLRRAHLTLTTDHLLLCFIFSRRARARNIMKTWVLIDRVLRQEECYPRRS